MDWITAMAMRNLRRNRRRTVLAAVSIGLSVMLMTFMSGYVNGFMRNMAKNVTKTETGHIRITTSGFDSRSRFMPVDECISDPAAAVAALRASPALAGELDTVAERILFGTLLSNGPNTKTAFGFAGDPETEKNLLGLDRSIVEGNYLAGRGETIIGRKLAADLGLSVGDSIRVVTQGADYGLHLKKFRISGIFFTNLNQLDSGAFQIPLEDAKELLRTGGGVQQILVMLKDYRKASALVPTVEAALKAVPGAGTLVAKSWREIGEYPKLITMMEKTYGNIYLLVALLGAFIISNILMMVVLERKKEIGILKSLGLKRREVLRLFVTEGAAMGALGSGAGAILGLGINAVFSVYGIDFSSALGNMTMPLDPVLHTVFDPLAAVQMFFLGILVAIAVSILPSRRAATVNAVDAIKSVM